MERKNQAGSTGVVVCQMSELFYSPLITEKNSELSGDESRHCIQVLRNRVGNEINITDGKGILCKCRIISYDKNKCQLEIIEKKEIARENFNLHIAISPVKHSDRLEWFIEKAVEIGVDTISFIDCKRTERKKINIDRLQKIAISAIKQSLRYYLPTINSIKSFEKFISDGLSQLYTTKLICADRPFYLPIKKHLNTTGSYLVMIGPEGDFTVEEIKSAEQNGFKGTLLGNHRLRTETAGIYVCASINTLFEK